MIRPSPGRRWLPALAVAGVAVASGAASLGNRFAQDDVLLIEEHFLLHSLGNWQAILTSPYWPPPHTDVLYRPVASLLHAVQYSLGGGEPLVFRLTSILLYTLVALAVFALARRLMHPVAAAGAALLFAAHPVHVEAVALGVGQGEILVTLLAVTATTKYLDWRRQGEGVLTAGQWTTLGLMYLTASLTKEVGIVLPGLLVAGEFAVNGPSPRQRARKLWPGFATLIGVAALVLAIRAVVLAGGDALPSRAEALDGLGLRGRILTMLPVVVHWVRLLAWPAHLQADYAPQEIATATSFGVGQALGAGVLAVTLALAALSRRSLPVLTAGLAWIGVALLPVSNLFFAAGIVLAERTLFLPSVGWVFAFGAVGSAAWESAMPRRHGNLIRSGLAVLTVALVTAGILRSTARYPAWKNDTVYALQTGLDAPASWRAQMARGTALIQSGQQVEGMAAYRRSIELVPDRWAWRVRNDLARRYFETGQIAEAARELEASLAAVPGQEETSHYLVLSYLALARYDDAAARADSALARGFDPELFGNLRALADTMAQEGAPAGSLRINVRRGR